MRCSLRYRLREEDVVEWLAERGSAVDPNTIYDWVRTVPSRFADAARTHRSAVGRRWRVDEPSSKVAKRRHDLVCAINDAGQIVDVSRAG